MSRKVGKSTDELLDSTLIEDLRGHLPHWTPPKGDKIVYSTVDEGGSAKGDLRIEEDGYPQKFLLTGD